MPSVKDIYQSPPDLVLGSQLNGFVPEADQYRQRKEVEDLLRRLRKQPGVILADEVGMGKTFVALSVAYSVGIRSLNGPVVIMVPSNLVDKWEQDLKTFAELYLKDRQPILNADAKQSDWVAPTALRYGIARHSVELMKLLDDPPRKKCQLIFLTHGAMSRNQSDKWVRLALIAEALRRHATGRASRLIQVKKQIHRFLAQLLSAFGEQRANYWGDELWQKLIRTSPDHWREIYNGNIRREDQQLVDDPVPKYVVRGLKKLDLQPLAEALKGMPIRAGDDRERLAGRLKEPRDVLRVVENDLWKDLLAQTRWRSPLLIMDEAHHLKNPGTTLARQLQSPDLDRQLRIGDAAMARVFDRMLFLTATPFQLGHHELVRVLERFGDVNWDTKALGDIGGFHRQLRILSNYLNESQRSSITLQQTWSKLNADDCSGNVGAWWSQILDTPRETLTNRQRAVVDAYEVTKLHRDAAENALKSWILRNDKGLKWPSTEIPRRQRLEGAAILDQINSEGLQIPPHQLLPFFLAARSTATKGMDLLSEALCSSYEAFRLTREKNKKAKDIDDEVLEVESDVVDLSHSNWYLEEFDKVLNKYRGSTHPKIYATVQKTVDLWEAGEKVLVFAFYRQTCRALRIHISEEIGRRIIKVCQRRFQEIGRDISKSEFKDLIARIQNLFFDNANSPGRRALDEALNNIIKKRITTLDNAKLPPQQCDNLVNVMRRFLRVDTTLTRCFPIYNFDMITPAEAVGKMLNESDQSGMTWKAKFDQFIEFLTERCSSVDRERYLDVAGVTKTGRIRVDQEEDEDSGIDAKKLTFANVQVATGQTNRDTRARLMRAFNTPFFPDILVCSEVMGEGVDLHRYCRHVIHHDLAWNPSTIEQRVGRIDRLGCKAEGNQPIVVYTPYLAGTADERQFKVMSDREQWFRIVMGQDAVAKLITTESDNTMPLPAEISDKLNFRLGLT